MAKLNDLTDKLTHVQKINNTFDEAQILIYRDNKISFGLAREKLCRLLTFIKNSESQDKIINILGILRDTVALYTNAGEDLKSEDLLKKAVDFAKEFEKEKLNFEQFGIKQLDEIGNSVIEYNFLDGMSNDVQFFLTNNYQARITPLLSEIHNGDKSLFEYFNNNWRIKAKDKFEECLKLEIFGTASTYDSIRVNFALFLSKSGRFIESLEVLDNLISKDGHEYAPAIGHRCGILFRISEQGLVKKVGTVQALHKYIFQMLESLLLDENQVKSIIGIGGNQMLDYFTRLKEGILERYSNDIKFLMEEVLIHTHQWNYEYTNKFYNNCDQDGLFLNVQLFNNTCITQTFDDLRIPEKYEKCEIVNTLFNEIKESYITARFNIINSKNLEISDSIEINKLTYLPTPC